MQLCTHTQSEAQRRDAWNKADRSAGHTSRQAEFAIKGLRTRFPAQEVLEGLHLVLAATAFKDSMTVASAFFSVHWIFRKDREEHVRRVNLGTAHAVISIISTAPSVTVSGKGEQYLKYP